MKTKTNLIVSVIFMLLSWSVFNLAYAQEKTAKTVSKTVVETLQKEALVKKEVAVQKEITVKKEVEVKKEVSVISIMKSLTKKNQSFTRVLTLKAWETVKLVSKTEWLSYNEVNKSIVFSPAKDFVWSEVIAYDICSWDVCQRYSQEIQVIDIVQRSISSTKNAVRTISKEDLWEWEASLVSSSSKNGWVLNISKDWDVTYAPAKDFVGTDTFSVRVGEKSLDYSVSVLDTKQKSISSTKNTVRTISKADVWEWEVSLVSTSSKNGWAILLTKEWDMKYTPAKDFVGIDTFSIRVGNKVIEYMTDVQEPLQKSIEDETMKDRSIARSVWLIAWEKIISIDENSSERGSVTYNEKSWEWIYAPKESFIGKDSFMYTSEIDGLRTIITVDIEVMTDDTDGDWIKDIFEKDWDIDRDTDKDGEPDHKDIDSDDDGILDSVEWVDDIDKDWIPNYRDNDSDDDGLSDADEVKLWTDPYNRDTDGDWLTDGIEKELWTDLFEKDSDSDWINDKGEVDLWTDPLDEDTDDDGLKDGEEVTMYFTNPKNTDTDGWGKNDRLEVQASTDGQDPSDDFKRNWWGNWRVRIANTDSDFDTIPDTEESKKDTDEDGVPDYLDIDSDNDDISDAIEYTFDTDNDGVANYLDTDSDSDGISDSIEGEKDSDGDGTPNYLDEDSDNDGIPDIIDGILDRDQDWIVDYIDPTFDNETILALDISSLTDTRILITDPYVCWMWFFGKVYVTNDIDLSEITVTEVLYQDWVEKYRFNPELDKDGYFWIQVNYSDPTHLNYIQEWTYKVRYEASHVDWYKDEGEYITDIMKECGEENTQQKEWVEEEIEDMFGAAEEVMPVVASNPLVVIDELKKLSVEINVLDDESIMKKIEEWKNNLWIDTQSMHNSSNTFSLPAFLPQTGAYIEG